MIAAWFVAAVFGVVILSGCSGGTAAPGPAPVDWSGTQGPSGNATKFQVLHVFSENQSGTDPSADAELIGGVVYGTTFRGGTGRNVCGCGIVYAIDGSGQERTVHAFSGAKHAKHPADGDGAYPLSGLVEFNGSLYGATSAGGDFDPSAACPHGDTPGCGTVYSIDSSGKEHIIYRFQGGSDGIWPAGNLIKFLGKLYGVTIYGGGQGGYTCWAACGTVFAINAAGKETVVHRFTGGADGALPQAGLAVINGNLYGTTSQGGNGSAPCADCGTVFAIDRSGNLRTLYAFSGSYDGGNPQSNLVQVGDSIYGTSYSGGNRGFCGTIFSIGSSGGERTAWTFGCAPDDGKNPRGTLVVRRGVIYGATQYGGAYGCRFGWGCGTIFAFNPKTSQESLVESLESADGTQPVGLSIADGVLYGAAYQGGGGLRGNGTVFSIVP